MIRRPPRSTPKPSSAASDVYKRQVHFLEYLSPFDPLAVQYLEYVQRIRSDARQHMKDRAAAELERRSVQVNEIFGSVLHQSEKIRSTSESNYRSICTIEQSPSLVYQMQNDLDQERSMTTTNESVLPFSPDSYLSPPDLDLTEFSAFSNDMWTGSASIGTD